MSVVVACIVCGEFSCTRHPLPVGTYTISNLPMMPAAPRPAAPVEPCGCWEEPFTGKVVHDPSDLHAQLAVAERLVEKWSDEYRNQAIRLAAVEKAALAVVEDAEIMDDVVDRGLLLALRVALEKK